MKNLSFVIALVLVQAGCASRQAPAAADAPAAPAESVTEPEPPPPPPEKAKVAATCTTPECEEKCADAGDLASECAAAWAAGCFGDAPPDPAEFDCQWQRKNEAVIGTDERQSSEPPKDGILKAKPAKSGDTKVNLEKVNDE